MSKQEKQNSLFGGKYDQEPWEDEWKQMPEFIMDNKEPYKQLIVSFKNEEDYQKFSKLINQPLSPKTQSVWYPQAEIETYRDKLYTDLDERGIKRPQFPLYVVSKGRYMYMHTSKALTKMGVKHYIVVEPDEVKKYQEAIDANELLATIVELDLSYKEKYETCDEFGLSKSTGPGPARNFAWEHSIKSNYGWHWVMDDNIQEFFRLNKNLKTPCNSPSFWRAMEDFCLRYKNVSMAGPNYFFFAPRKSKQPAFTTNTRIYSCNLIRNDVPFRWRGRYNEDTILSLDMLSAGWCTIQFNAFLQDKLETQKLKGGNTDEFYHKEGEVKQGERYADQGTYLKSKMLVDVYPQLSEIVEKFGRVHHKVDYSPFKKNRLKLKEYLNVPEGIDNYNMGLKIIKE